LKNRRPSWPFFPARQINCQCAAHTRVQCRFEVSKVFTWLNKQGVRSDNGFEVQFTGRFDAEYRENDKVISIYVESGRHEGQPCIILYPNAFERWDDSPPEMKLPANEQTRISQNLIDAMAFQELRTIVESGD
jgi:hypothetical protein